VDHERLTTFLPPLSASLWGMDGGKGVTTSVTKLRRVITSAGQDPGHLSIQPRQMKTTCGDKKSSGPTTVSIRGDECGSVARGGTHSACTVGAGQVRLGSQRFDKVFGADFLPLVKSHSIRTPKSHSNPKKRKKSERTLTKEEIRNLRENRRTSKLPENFSRSGWPASGLGEDAQVCERRHQAQRVGPAAAIRSVWPPASQFPPLFHHE